MLVTRKSLHQCQEALFFLWCFRDPACLWDFSNHQRGRWILCHFLCINWDLAADGYLTLHFMNTTLWLLKAQFCSCLLEGTPFHLFFLFLLMQCMPFYTLILISELTAQTSGCYGNGAVVVFAWGSHKLRFVSYQPLQFGICVGSAVYFQ